jgi:hypothetical protein
MAGTADDIQEVAHTFDNLTDSIQKAATTSSKLRDTFLQLSKTTTSSGQAWTVLSRLSSGSGFWKIQNRIRAISNFLQYQDHKASEMAKSEKEAIANLGEQMKLKKDIANASKVLKAITDGSATAEERTMFYQSEQFRYLEQLYGKQEAMVNMKERLTYASEQLAITDKDMLNNRVKQQKILLEKSLDGWGLLWDGFVKEDTQYKRFMNMNIDLQRTFMEFSDATDKLQGQKNDKLRIEQEMLQKSVLLRSKIGQYDRAVEKKTPILDAQGNPTGHFTDSGKSESEKAEYLRQKNKLQAEFDVLSKYLEDVDNELEKTTEVIMQNEQYLKYQGISVGVNAEGKAEIDKDTEKDGFGKRMIEKVTSFIDKFPGGTAILGLFRGAKLFFLLEAAEKKKAIGDVLLKIAKPLGMVLRGMLIYFPILLLLLYALKQSGWLDVIMGLIRGIGMWLAYVWEGLVEFFVNVGIFFGSIINLIGTIFNGSSSEVRIAMWETLQAAFWMAEKFLKLVFINMLGALIIGGFLHVLSTVAEKYIQHGVISGIFTVAKDILSAFIAWTIFNKVMSYAQLGPLSALTAAILGFIVSDAAGGFAAKKIGVEGYAEGGLVNRSGTYLVGERGPEIVSMRKGSYVTPNHELRGNTTINVSVNGRIGASDSELNDIANKLSNIINQRMQRAGSSGVFR